MTDAQRSLIDDLNLIENPQERLAILVDRARRAPPLPDAARSPAHLVPGCISQVWLLCEIAPAPETCRIRCDADSPLVKALAVLLCDYYSGCTPAEILAEPADAAGPLAALGLLATLSPTRRNGLAQVRARIRAFAAHAAEASGPTASAADDVHR